MDLNQTYDACVIGSGAGAGPVIQQLALAGFKVLVLEKGPWLKTEHFTKDELVACRRDVYTPNLQDEFHEIENLNDEGEWKSLTTKQSGSNYWNGNCVGGSSNFMSAYFHRLKPNDFNLKSVYGDIKGANVVDWPINYEDLEPFYAQVESEVGVSGQVVNHEHQEPRSTPDFPYPPLQTNIVAQWLEKAGQENQIPIVPVARGIISTPKAERNGCYYSNYCGSYGCQSNAKSSSRVALINSAIKTGNVDLLPNSKVFYLKTNGSGQVVEAHFHSPSGDQKVKAKVFVVAAQAIETSRLLLNSQNEDCPNGLGNHSNQLGKNLIFSGGGIGGGNLYFEDFKTEEVEQLKRPGLFVNRSILKWYEINDESVGGKIKGGLVDFVFEHSNPMPKVQHQKWEGSRLVYGSELKEKIKDYFTKQRKLKFEIFNDWLPTDDCFVSLSDEVDKWGDRVAKVRIGYHPHDLKVARYLADKAETVLKSVGAKNVSTGISGLPSPNLVAGGCRFGDNPQTSVLNSNCQIHTHLNTFVTDASFMPTGGSVPYTWTIYANSFRVSKKIIDFLSRK